MRSWALVIAALGGLAGCGRLGFDTRPGDGGDSGDGAVTGTPIALALPAGGEIDEIRVAADGRWYAVTSAGAVYRSDDNQTWVACGDVVASGVAVPKDNRVFVSGDDVMVSTDQCATWQPTGVGRYSEEVVARDFNAYALVDIGLQELVGTSWTTIVTPLDGARFKTMAVHSPAAWLLGTNSGLMHSSDGVTWTTVGGTLPTLNIIDVATSLTKTYAITAASGASVGGIACSDGNATTWTSCANIGGTSIAVDPSDDNHAFAAIYDGLVETHDGFATGMVDQRGGAMGAAIVRSIRFLADSSVLAATDRGVFVAAAGTINWQARHTGLAAWNVTSIARAGDELYLGTEGGVLHGVVGQPYSASFEGMHENTQVNAVAVAPDGTVIATGRHIWTSTDRGATFAEPVQLDITDGYRGFAITLAGARVYVGTGGSVQIADPPYTSWTRNALGHAANALLHDGTTLWVGTDAGLYRSPDGVAFTQVTALPSDPFGALAQLSDGSLVVGGGSNGVWLSDPTRTTWTNIGPSKTVVRLAEAGGAIVASTGGGVYATRDRGTTWTLAPATAALSTGALLFDPADGTLVVGTVGHGIVKTAIP